MMVMVVLSVSHLASLIFKYVNQPSKTAVSIRIQVLVVQYSLIVGTLSFIALLGFHVNPIKGIFAFLDANTDAMLTMLPLQEAQMKKKVFIH